MPHPSAIYASIARGSRQDRLEGITANGVRLLDRLICEMHKTNPVMLWEDVLRSITIDGRPLDHEQVRAAIQLREARRQGLLVPGDELL